MAKAKTRTITRYAKRRHHKKAGFTLPLAAIAGFIPMVSYAYDVGYKGEGIKGFGKQIVYQTTGYDPYSGKWDWNGIVRGLGPVILGLMAHKFIGGKLGVNRMLGNAGVPIIRL